jgi:hypothetical protein
VPSMHQKGVQTRFLNERVSIRRPKSLEVFLDEDGEYLGRCSPWAGSKLHSGAGLSSACEAFGLPRCCCAGNGYSLRETTEQAKVANWPIFPTPSRNRGRLGSPDRSVAGTRRRRRPPNCWRCTRFSSIRYAITSRSRRSSQPVITSSNTRSAESSNIGASLHQRLASRCGLRSSPGAQRAALRTHGGRGNTQV